MVAEEAPTRHPETPAGPAGPADLSELLGPEAEAAAAELGDVVRGILRRFSGRYPVAREQFEDLAQQVMVACLHHAERIRRGEAPPLRNRDAWLVRVTHNAILSALRSRSRRHDREGWPDGFDPPAPAPLGAEERLAVRRALGALDELCRRLLILRDVLGEARSAIARRLGITSNALGARLHRCRRKLLQLYLDGGCPRAG